MKILWLTGALLAALLSALIAGDSKQQSKEGDPYANETKEARDARMAWWREAKFGMFIHWGVYAVPAGEYKGEAVGGIGEWILRNGKIPHSEYRAYAKDFTAENYDPKAWAALAKEAGMRYMVITSKHHDGFALFPSKVSEWNALQAAGSKRDLIEPLAKAARAEGLKFGLYYSQSQDWIHPGGAIYGYKEGEVIDPAHKGNYDEYLKNIAVPQVREILTTYQPDVLWWDTPMYMTPERAKPLVELLKLKPGIIHNNRLGGGYHGDTETPEQYIPATGFPGRDWETCMTMNNTWGFKKNDHEWKSSALLISNLINAASKGGNYLLNIGPDPKGQVPAESIRLLKEVGAWMKVNGESIYGTQASPFACRLSWGRCTMKAEGANTLLYLHVIDWPRNGKLRLPGLQNKILGAQMLADRSELKVVAAPLGPEIELKGGAPGAA
ncbi:MAG TPA: alpha-L-fucosidase, partial [Luteolibacter sp.]|nr:alpha-L-fucosidase [Luteolibacter sp.]